MKSKQTLLIKHQFQYNKSKPKSKFVFLNFNVHYFLFVQNLTDYTSIMCNSKTCFCFEKIFVKSTTGANKYLFKFLTNIINNVLL